MGVLVCVQNLIWCLRFWSELLLIWKALFFFSSSIVETQIILKRYTPNQYLPWMFTSTCGCTSYHREDSFLCLTTHSTWFPSCSLDYKFNSPTGYLGISRKLEFDWYLGQWTILISLKIFFFLNSSDYSNSKNLLVW